MTLNCVIAIAFNLFVLELNESINMEIFIALVDLGAELGMTAAHFFLSEYITMDLLKIGDIFYNSPWFQLPTKQQMRLVLPIQRAQREIRLTGLDLFQCSLDVFVSVGHLASKLQKGRLERICEYCDRFSCR